jgi:WD40 repeat protein
LGNQPLHVLNAETEKLLFDMDLREYIRRAAFSPIDRVVFLQNYGDCFLVDLQARKAVQKFSEPSTVSDPQFTADGRWLLMRVGSNRLRAVDTRTWKTAALPDFIPTDTVKYVPGKTLALLETEGGDINLWDPVAKRSFATIYSGSQRWRSAFSPDGGAVVLAYLPRENRGIGRGENLEIFSTHDGKRMHQLREADVSMPDSISSVAWSADGNYLLAGTYSMGKIGTVSMWNLKTGRQSAAMSDPKILGQIDSFAFIADNKKLVAKWEIGAIGFFDMTAIFKGVRDFERTLSNRGRPTR